MWLFRKKGEDEAGTSRSEAREHEGEAGAPERSAEMEAEKNQPKAATPEENAAAASSAAGGKSKNRRRPPKKNGKGGAKGVEKEEKSVSGGDSLQDREIPSTEEGESLRAHRKEGAVVSAAPAAQPEGKAIAELQKELGELAKKNDALLEQVKVAEATQEGLEKVLEVKSQELQASQQTIEATKEQDSKKQVESLEKLIVAGAALEKLTQEYHALQQTIETTQEQGSKKQVELLEKLIVSEQALEASTKMNHESQQTIEAMKEQLSASQSGNRELGAAVKERIDVAEQALEKLTQEYHALQQTIETTLEEESKKHAELLEKLTIAEQALEASTKTNHESQQTIKALKEKKSTVQSWDRELCTAMKERIYAMARKVGEASYDWKICCESIEKMTEEREAVKIMSDKLVALAVSVGEESGDLDQCFAAIEAASSSSELCKAMQQQIVKLAIPLGETSTDWEQGMARIAHTLARASASLVDIDILREKVVQAASMLDLDLEPTSLDRFFAHIPQLKAEKQVWTSAQERIVKTAGMLGAGSVEWVQGLSAMEHASREHRASMALSERVQSIAASVRTDSAAPAGSSSELDDSDSTVGAGLACVAALEQMAAEWRELRQRADVSASERALFKEAMDGLFSLGRSLGEDSGDWRRCLAAVEHAAASQAERAEMEQRITALASGVVRGVVRGTAGTGAQSTEWPAQSTEWRRCLAALEEERETAAEVGSAMQRRILELGRRLGAGAEEEEEEEWPPCMAAIETACEHALAMRGWDAGAQAMPLAGPLPVNLNAGSEAGPEQLEGAMAAGMEAGARGLLCWLEELLAGMQAQGWELRSFFKAEVPEPLRRSDVYLLLHALISEHHDRLRIVAKRSLYTFSDEEDLSEDTSDAWLSPPPAEPAAPLYPLSEVPEPPFHIPPPPLPDTHAPASPGPPSMLYQSMAHVPVAMPAHAAGTPPRHAQATLQPASPPGHPSPPAISAPSPTAMPVYQSMAGVPVPPLAGHLSHSGSLPPPSQLLHPASPSQAPPALGQGNTGGGSLYQSMAHVPVHNPPPSPARLGGDAASPPSPGTAAALSYPLNMGQPGAPASSHPALSALFQHPSTPVTAPSSSSHAAPSDSARQAPLSAPPWHGPHSAASIAAEAAASGERRGSESLEAFVARLMEPDRPLTTFYSPNPNALAAAPDPSAPLPSDQEPQKAGARSDAAASALPLARGGSEPAGGQGAAPTWSEEAEVAKADSAQLQAALWEELGLRLKAGGEGGAVRVVEKALGNVGHAVREVRAGDSLVWVNGWASTGHDLDTVARVILVKRLEGLVLGVRGRKGGAYQVTVPAPMMYSAT